MEEEKKEVKLGEFVKYDQTGFHLDCNKEKLEKLEKLGLRARFSEASLWIYSGANSITVFADSSLMIYTYCLSPDKDREIVVRPRLTEDEARKILDLPIARRKWDLNWDIFKQISEEVVGGRIEEWMRKNLKGRILEDTISVSYDEHTGEIEISVVGTDFSRDDLKAMKDQLQLAHLSWDVHAFSRDDLKAMKFVKLRIKAKLEAI